MGCVNKASKEFKDLAARHNVAENALELITHKYWLETGNETLFPTDVYIQAQLGNTFYKESGKNVRMLWDKVYSSPKEFTSMGALQVAYREAEKYFPKSALVHYQNAKGNFVLSVKKPVESINYTKDDFFNDEDSFKSVRNAKTLDLGLKEKKVYGIDKAKELYDRFNIDRTSKDLAERVFKIANELNLKISFNEELPFGTLGRYQNNNTITYKKSFFERDIRNNTKAPILLHEILHAVSMYALSDSTKNWKRSKDIEDFKNEITSVFQDLKDNPILKGERGIVDIKEFVAELANPVFRAKIQEIDKQNKEKKTFWSRILDAFKSLLGLHVTNSYYQRSMNALDKALNSFDIDSYMRYNGIKNLLRLGYNEKDWDFRTLPDNKLKDAIKDYFDKETYNEELLSIKKKAIADGTFMKAPNGKPTNLNERQWLQVRTKAFKDWFGDWEKEYTPQTNIYKENPWERYMETEDTGRTYIGHSGKTIPIIINKGIKYVHPVERITPTDKDPFGFNSYNVNNLIVVGKEVDADRNFNGICQVTARACKDFLKNRYNIESSIVIINAKSPVKDDIIEHWVNVLSINGEAYIYDMPQTEYIKQTKPLIYDNKELNGYYEGVITSKYTPRLIKVTEENLSKFYKDNNKNDKQIKVIKDTVKILNKDKKSINLNDLQYKPAYDKNVSKVVDENGEPLVVYHGTTTPDIHIFDLEKTVSGKAFWFANEAAQKLVYYGSKSNSNLILMPLYVNMKKPLLNDANSMEDYATDESHDGGLILSTLKDFKDNLDEEEYQAALDNEIKDSDIIATGNVTNPNQLKSATDNVGTFSTDNDEIYNYEVDSSAITELKPQYRGKLIYAQSGTGKSTIADNKTVFDSDYILGNILGVSTETAGFFFKTLSAKQKKAFGEQYRETIKQMVADGYTVLTANESLLNDADIVIYNQSAQQTDERVNGNNRALTNKYHALEYHQNTLAKIKKLKDEDKENTRKYVELDEKHYLSDVISSGNNLYNRTSNLHTDSEQKKSNAILEEQQRDHIISSFLNEFGISVNMLDNYDGELPLFDALNKVINARTKADITEGVGYAIAFMMQSDPEIQRMIVSSHGMTGDYNKKIPIINKKIKSLHPNQHSPVAKEVLREIGRQITSELKDNFGTPIEEVKSKKTIWKVIKNFFTKIGMRIAALGKRNKVLKQENLFVKDIIEALSREDFSRIKGPNIKEDTTELAQRVYVEQALKDNPFEDNIIRKLGEHGIALAGSTSIALQGSLFRPSENPLHDIDFNAGDNSSKESLDKLLPTIFPNGTIQFSHPLPKDRKGNQTVTYILLSEPFTIKKTGYNTAEFYSKDGRYLGKRVHYDLFLEDGVQGKMLDFFTGPTKKSDHGFYKRTINGHTYLISESNAAMAAKIKWARPKDMWDYKRFIKDTFKATDFIQSLSAKDLKNELRLIEQEEADYDLVNGVEKKKGSFNFDFEKPKTQLEKDLEAIKTNDWNLPEEVRKKVEEKLEKYIVSKSGEVQQDIDVSPYFGKDNQTTAKNVLKYIIENSTDREIKNMAQYVLNNLGKNTDVPVKFFQNGKRKHSSKGTYYASTHSIKIDAKSLTGSNTKEALNRMEGTIIHEIAHAITSRAIDSDPAARKEILEIFSEFTKLRSQYGITLGYASKNPKEFVAEFLGNKAFREALMELPSSTKKVTLGQKILNFIKKILGIPVKNTFFNRTDDAILRLMDYANAREWDNTQSEDEDMSTPQTFTFADGTVVKAPFKPNAQQIDALNEMDRFIKSDEISMTLSGYAGTGKTSIMQMLAEKAKKQHRRVEFCASTNKAAAVLNDKVSKSGFQASTLNKLFGITVEVDPNSKSYNAKNLVNALKDNNLFVGTTVIIDEASMINEENYNIINEIAKNNYLKIIYVGDEAQLAPVNEENISKVFRNGDGKVIRLTQVERTDDNAILKEATDLRNDKPLSGISSFNAKGEGVAYIAPQHQEAVDEVVEHFVEGLKKDPNYFRILAYTNKVVSKYNDQVRELLGYTTPIPQVGEPMAGYTNWGYTYDYRTKKGTYRFINSESYKVISVGKPTKVSYSLNGIPVIMEAVPVTLEDSMGKRDTFNYMDIKSNSQNRHNAEILANEKNRLWKETKKRGIGRDVRIALYGKINDIEKFLFVNDSVIGDEGNVLQSKVIDFGYAMTVHKSQGSTFTNVLVDDVDISRAGLNNKSNYTEAVNLEEDTTNIPSEDNLNSMSEVIDLGDLSEVSIEESSKTEAPEQTSKLIQQLEYVAVSRATDTVTIISNDVKKEGSPLHYIKDTKNVENFQGATTILPKFRGAMSFSYGNAKRADVKSSTTFDAIKAGERTATTRYTKDGNISYWKQVKVGDIIEFHNNKGEKIYVEVVKPLTLLPQNTSAEAWSQKEGWNTAYFDKNVKPEIEKGEAYQMEYKYLGVNNIGNYVQIHKGNWSREEAERNPKVLYVFTDNTDRDSGSGIIPNDSWYSKKYGQGHHFPTMTAAVVRGLDNARPISTQRWYHQGAKGTTGRWTDADINEFKKTIKEELQEIINEFNTNKYDTIMFPDGDGLFNTRISNITKERTPKLYQALGELLYEFGFDSLVPTDILNSKSQNNTQKAINTILNFKPEEAEFYSGAANGSDKAWEEAATKAGIKVTNYTVENWNNLSNEWKERLDKEYQEIVNILGRRVLDINSYAGKLVRRDMMQADKADAIFAIGTLASNGYVDGGTGYASTRGILRGIPVYLFDQKDSTWKVWDKAAKKFVPTSQPSLTKNAAVIGTRELQENGKKAIENMFQTSNSNIEYKKDGEVSIKYTPTGKETQTYIIKGNQIFNKDGKEVFKEDSVDRNKIFANLAVQQGRAVVVEHNNRKYVVNNRSQIISGTTGKLLQWRNDNGDRRAIIKAAGEKFKERGVKAAMEKSVQEAHKDVLNTLGNDEQAQAEIQSTLKTAVMGIALEKALDAVNPVFTKEEQEQIKKALGEDKKLQVMSVSRMTDPVFFTKEIINFLAENAKKPFTDASRVNAIEIWSKHDGIPMQELLKACKKYKVAPMVSFSITGLGDTTLERGVMKYNDLLDRIEKYIKAGDLNPSTTTVRIDPILIGETNLDDIKAIVNRAKSMGIKKFVSSLVQSYGYLDGTPRDRKVVSGINAAMEREHRTYDWDKYYGRITQEDFAASEAFVNKYRATHPRASWLEMVSAGAAEGVRVVSRSSIGKIHFIPKQEYIEEIGKVLLEINKDPEIELETCSFVIKGLRASACLDPLILERITGVDVTDPNGRYKRDTSRPDCMCYGAHSDMFRMNEKKCFSSCAYCYAGKSDSSAISYYNEDGSLKDTIYTRTEDTVTKTTSDDKALLTPDTKINIYAGTNENADLSNFAVRPFSDAQHSFESVEQGFQFGKFEMLKSAIYSAYTVRDAAYKDIMSQIENIQKKLLAIKRMDFHNEISYGATLKSIGNTRLRAKDSDLQFIIDAFFTKKKIEGAVNWYTGKIASNIMKALLKASFEQNPQAAQRLLDTGNATLTHTQDKGKWGTEFPKLLMEVREELRKEKTSTEDFSDVFQTPNTSRVETEDVMKPWKKDTSKENKTRRIYLKGQKDKGYFEIVKDLEDNNYSIHFKPTDSKNPNAFTEEEKNILFQAAADVIPEGANLSTWGELSKGGIHGLNRFLDLGFVKTGDRNAKMKTGEDVNIPILTKSSEASMDNLSSKTISLPGYEELNGLYGDTPVDAEWKIPYLKELDAQISGEKSEEDNNNIINKMNTILQATSEKEYQQETQDSKKTETQNVLNEYDKLLKQFDNLLDNEDGLTASEIRHIAELVGNDLSDMITDLQKEKGLAKEQFPSLETDLDFQSSSRRKIVETVDINRLIDRCKKLFSTEVVDYDDVDQMLQADVIIDNFDAIMHLAADVFALNEGFGIVKDYKTGKYTLTKQSPRIDYDNFHDYSNDEDIAAENGEKDGQEHWQVESRTIDVLTSMSALVRQGLHDCYLLDENGNKIYSRWQIAERVNPRDAVNSILRWTQGSQSLKDMISKLSQKQKRNPWLSQLITRLSDTSGKETDFQSQFYGVMSKHFQSYSIIVLEDGKYHNVPVNNHPALSEAMKTITAQFKMGELPLFGDNGKINAKVLGNDNTISENSDFNFHKALAELQTIRAIIDHGNPLEEKDIETASANIMGICRNFGYNVTEDMVSEILDTDNLRYMTEKLGFLVKDLDKALKDQKNGDLKVYDPFKFKGKYAIDTTLKNFLTPITEVLEDTAINAFYDSGKMYQSYVIPSYWSMLMNKFNLNGHQFEDFIRENYASSEWFRDKKAGIDLQKGWRNEWLRRLVTDENARKIFSHKVELNFNKHNYMRNMTDAEYTVSMIAEYFAENTNIAEDQAPSWYRVPMQSNKPSSEYIRFYSYRGDKYKDSIVYGLTKMFLQELSRIQTINMRNLSKEDPEFIKNFDTNGRKFCFLPVFNNYLEDSRIAKEGRTVLKNEDGSISSDNNLFAHLLQKKIKGEVALTEDEDTKFSTLTDKIIRNSVENRVQKILSEWEENGIIEAAKSIKGIYPTELDDEAATRWTKEQIENFLWNDTFASKNILQLTITDIAFYKDTEDLQKRLAQLHAPGIRANVEATDYEGNRVSDGKYRTFIIRDYDDFISNIIDNLNVVFDRKIAAAQGKAKEVLIELKDSLTRPRTYNEDGTVKDKGGRYWNINVTDAQGYSSPTSYRKKAFEFGKWSRQAERIYQKLLKGTYTYTDLETAFQPLKPFVYAKLHKNLGVDKAPITSMPIPFQAKNAEYLLIMADAILQGEKELSKPNLLRAIYRIMEDSAYDGRERDSKGNIVKEGTYNGKGIDTVQFESAIKSSLQGAIDIHQFLDMQEGEEAAYTFMKNQIYKEKYRDSQLEPGKKERVYDEYNTDVFVHETSFDHYCLQQEVPEHFKEHSQAHGSQIRMTTPSDLDFYTTDENGKQVTNYYTWKEPDGTVRKVTAEEFRKEYEDTIAANIKESIDVLKAELHLNIKPDSSYEDIRKEQNIALAKILQREILASPRYGVDLLQACSIDKKTGEFRIPKGDPVQAKRIEQLINSIIKNRINKQEIAGGPIVQVSNFGTSKQLHIRFNDKNGNLIPLEEEYKASEHGGLSYKEYLKKNQGGIAYFEVYIPIWANDIFKKFANPDGTINIEAIEAIDPELLKMISYRIPTEEKYSCAPMKAVGFMPKEAGDAIMFPFELTEIDDSDFDVDKRYVMRKDIPILDKDPSEFLDDLVERGNDLYKNIMGQEAANGYVRRMVESILKNPMKFPTNSPFRKVLFSEYQKVAYYTKAPVSGRKYRDNKIVDMTFAVLTNEMTADKILNPGGFDGPKKMGYLITAYKNPMVRAKGYSWEDLQKMSTDDLKKLSYTDKDLTYADTQVQFYKQNSAAASLIGVFAVNKIAHATLESNDIWLDVAELCGEDAFNIAGHYEIDEKTGEKKIVGGMTFKDRMQIDVRYDIAGNLIGKTLGSLVSASADAGKDPILNLMNINMTTAGMLNTMLRLGMTFEDASLFLSQDIIERLLNQFNRENLTNYVSLSELIDKWIFKYKENNKIIDSSKINTEALTKEELIEGITPEKHGEIDYKVLLTFKKLQLLTDAMRKPTFATRFNSISSAVGPLILDNLIQESKRDSFLSENGDTHFYTADGRELDINDIFSNHPILEQFARTLDLAKTLFLDMPSGCTGFRELLKNVPDDIKNKMYNDKKLFDKFANFYQSYLLIQSGVINQDRLKYYVNEFAKEFNSKKYDEKYPDNELLKEIKLQISKSGKPYLQIKITGMDEQRKEELRSAWIDLHKADPELSKKLFDYSFFIAGIGFSPKTFMALVPTYVKERLKGENGASYIDTYRKFPTVMNDVVIDQFICNNWGNNKLVPIKKSEDYSFIIDTNSNTLKVSKENEKDELKNVSYMKLKVADNMYLYKQIGKNDNEDLIYERMQPLGNNGEYLEMYTSKINSPLTAVTKTTEEKENEPSDLKTSSPQETDATSSSTEIVISKSEQEKNISELIDAFMLQNPTFTETSAKEKIEEIKKRGVHKYLKFLQNVFEKKGLHLNLEEVEKEFEKYC